MRKRGQPSNEARKAEWRNATATKRSSGLYKMVPTSSDAHKDWLKQLPFIPADTRNLTARLFGDPLPERSALHAKQQGRSE